MLTWSLMQAPQGSRHLDLVAVATDLHQLAASWQNSAKMVVSWNRGSIVRASLSLLFAAAVMPLLPLPAAAAEVCSSSESTVAETRCVIAALKTMDQSLEKALARVAKEAKEVPSEVFQTLWRDNLTGFCKTRADPKAQASAFQGTGYGIFTTRCELALTQTLLDQLKP